MKYYSTTNEVLIDSTIYLNPENMKFQYFGHLMQRAVSFEKILMLGKIEGRRRRA